MSQPGSLDAPDSIPQRRISRWVSVERWCKMSGVGDALAFKKNYFFSTFITHLRIVPRRYDAAAF